MKILLAATLLTAAAALSSCGIENFHGPGASDSATSAAPWNPPVEAQAGELISGVPQPPRR